MGQTQDDDEENETFPKAVIAFSVAAAVGAL
jgi:hypothetical protein